jgi:hypothetical protein
MIGQNRQAAFQQAKANHDFEAQELELKTNNDLTRQIHLAEELHRRLIDGSASSPRYCAAADSWPRRLVGSTQAAAQRPVRATNRVPAAGATAALPHLDGVHIGANAEPFREPVRLTQTLSHWMRIRRLRGGQLGGQAGSFVSPTRRHSDELPCGAGLLNHHVRLAADQASGGRQHG